MPELFSAEWFTSLLIFLVVQAVPSAAFGIVLAGRVSRPFWHGLLAGFFLPWIGLLFIPRHPAGERYSTGVAHYSMTMLFVAFLMTLISVFLNWVEVPDSQQSYAPARVFLVAILVCLVALTFLTASIGLLFNGGLPMALCTAIIVSTLVGGYMALNYLDGIGTLFRSLLPDGAEVQPGRGAWLALVGVITGYISLVVAPFGLKERPFPPPEPPAPPSPTLQLPDPQRGGASPASSWNDSQSQSGGPW